MEKAKKMRRPGPSTVVVGVRVRGRQKFPGMTRRWEHRRRPMRYMMNHLYAKLMKIPAYRFYSKLSLSYTVNTKGRLMPQI